MRGTIRRASLVAALVVAMALLHAPPARGQAGGASPDVRRERLANGLTVLVRENPVAPVVAVSLLVRTGTRWETEDEAGISNFLHAVMVKGTTRRSGAALAEAVSAIGGTIGAAGDVDYSGIRGTALARFWRSLLSLTAELALEPRLAPEEVDRERDSLLSRVQRRQDNAVSRAFDGFYALIYGPHPYGLPPLGTPDSLRRIDHAAIVARYRSAYRPGRMVLAVSGQVRADEVFAEAGRLFGAMAPGGSEADPAIPPPPPLGQRPADSLHWVIEQPAQQAQVVAGGLAPPLDHRDHAAVKVLSTVLGGGMAGRLFAELRDRRGLAYNASAFYDPVRGPGALALYLGTAPENAAKAEEGLASEIARIRDQRVGDEELARAKAYLLGRYALDRRTNERIAWYLAFYEIEGVGLDYAERYRQAVEAVTADDVQRAARVYLMPAATLVLRPSGR